MRELGQEKHRYEAAISELQAAREALVDVATLVRWLDSGDVGEAATGLALDRMLVELRNDAEQLAADPDRRPQPEPQVDIERMRDGLPRVRLKSGASDSVASVHGTGSKSINEKLI